eukprot:TRINITY_DN29486_c0_g1_i2.p1 TRINITY_DN29486_c0_g1~~TRINITY_DN29486_c0_g1_i2.p1  ORF type:complete len:268 (-),score=58.83 TRINITY_DN29486_c0_g1_i2:676-1479(-)
MSQKELIVRYGFVDATHTGHSIPLSLQLDSELLDPLYESKSAVLSHIERSMLRYSEVRFSMLQGFAASELSAAEVAGLLSGASYEDEDERSAKLSQEALAEVLSVLRIAVLTDEDVARHSVLVHAFREGRKSALANLKASHAVLDAAVELRAARRLEDVCSSYLVALCPAPSCEQAEVTHRVEAAVASTLGQGREETVAMVAEHVALQTQLYVLLRDIARAVAQTIQRGQWPRDVSTEDPAIAVHLLQWQESYKNGLGARDTYKDEL